jgi:protein-tyrosine phosphatase
MVGMVDVHTHILPFVDDGSPDEESSFAMIREEIAQGVTDLFFTPHYYPARGYWRTAAENRVVFEDFAGKAAGLGATLHLGNEIYYTIDSIRDLRQGSVLPLGDSKYVLLEFSMAKEEEDIAEAIHNVRAIGFLPIIAHPERYPYLDCEGDVGIIRRMGGAIQINASSIVGKYGAGVQKNCFRMLKAGAVDFVASDLHTFRRNDMKEAYGIVAKRIGADIADAVFGNRAPLLP